MDLYSALFGLFMFSIGACVGSFLNVLIDRLPRRESVFFTRSHCDNCQKKLSVFELIPILSYVFLGGKCRHCKKPITKRVIIVEALTAVIFLVTSLAFLNAYISLPFAVLGLFVVCLGIVIFCCDLEYEIIPDEAVLGLVVSGLAYLILYNPSQLLAHLITGFIAFLLFLLLFLVTKERGIGFGDVKLVFALGLILGYPNVIVCLYLAFLTGAVVSLILIAWGKKKLRKDTIPFGPFLVGAAAISYFWGDQLVNMFLKLIL